jgi:hypothetical protein
MTLWSARNGYIGMGAVAALVEADTEEQARALASEAFARDIADNRLKDDNEKRRYAEVDSILPVALPFVGDELP